MDVGSVLTGGGVAGLMIAAVAVGRLALDWLKERSGEPRAERGAAVSDAATTNAMLLASLKEERESAQQLSAEVAELRAQNAALYQAMREQRRDYEREVGELRKQLTALTKQVDAFQQRLHGDSP